MRRLFANHAAVLPLGLICIVAIILVPLPSWLMDLLLGASVASSLALLVLSMHVERTLQLSTFPSLLLITTLLRLALSIASTKLILLHAHAGQLIEVFGKIVVGGNVIVGLVIFLIITLVQFVVIAKGSERVAEVGARFTLDSMPGKQMSIEADLRAGMITPEIATERRRELDQESQFHGSMDGAMKFVKGDAVATLLIAFVNILAGLAIGIASKGMSFAAALERYTILTVGDGMVAQIPSLITSVAAGILITRVSGAAGTRLSEDIQRQIAAQPMVLLLIGAVCFVCAWVPGLPHLQLAGLGALLVVGGWAADKRIRSAQSEARFSLTVDEQKFADVTVEHHLPQFAPSLWVAVSPSMARWFDASWASSELLKCRARLAKRLGLTLAPVRIFADESLSGNVYAIHVHDLSMGVVSIPTDCYARRGSFSDGAAAERAELQALGPIEWVPSSRVSNADDPQWMSFYALLARHLEAIVMSRADALVGLEETSRMIAVLEREMPELTREALKACPLPRASEVLKRLVGERVSLRSMRPILESLVKWAPRERDTVLLAEQVRVDLGPSLVQRFTGTGDRIEAIVVDPVFEHELAAAVEPGSQGPVLTLDAAVRSALDEQLRAAVLQHAAAGGELPILVAEAIRASLSALVSHRHPQLCVFSYAELPAATQVVPLAVLQQAGAT